MASYLVYYAKERAQYPEADAVGVAPEVASMVLPKIFAHFGAPNIKMSVNPRARNWSWYRAGDGLMTPRGRRSFRTQEIVIAKTMMNWRVLAHEVAHALHCWDFNNRYSQSSTFARPKRERWHGPQHKEWMAKVIEYLKSSGVLPEASRIWSLGKIVEAGVKLPESELVGAGVDQVQGEVRLWNDYMRREKLAELPATMVCPRCLHSRAKEEFGTRIIRKSPQGRATKVVRQSYCKPCR